jgi:hypothetical protein
MPHRRYNDRSLVFVENYTPITNAKPHAVAPFEALHITMTGCRKLCQPLVDPAANIRRELGPLTRACGSEGNRPYVDNIA